MIDCTAPSELIVEYERYPAGDPGAAPLLAEATAAVAAHVANTTARIFDDSLGHRSADTVAQFAHLTSRPSAATCVRDFVEYHRRALASRNEPLAEMLRSQESLAELAAAAGSSAHPARPEETYDTARNRAGEEACARFRRAVAEQLAAAPGHPLADAARDMLAAEQLEVRLHAAEAKHQAAAAAAAATAAAAARAAKEAADKAEDAVEVQRMLGVQRQAHGLPETVTSGPWVEQQLQRLPLLAQAKRRLRTTRVDAVRVSLRSGPGLFGVEDLARTLDSSPVGELRAVLAALDVAEGRS